MVRVRDSFWTHSSYITHLAQEIATLRKEAQAFKSVRAALRTPQPGGDADAAKLIFQKVNFP